jgi:hypothetical protein
VGYTITNIITVHIHAYINNKLSMCFGVDTRVYFVLDEAIRMEVFVKVLIPLINSLLKFVKRLI